MIQLAKLIHIAFNATGNTPNCTFSKTELMSFISSHSGPGNMVPGVYDTKFLDQLKGDDRPVHNSIPWEDYLRYCSMSERRVNESSEIVQIDPEIYPGKQSKFLIFL